MQSWKLFRVDHFHHHPLSVLHTSSTNSDGCCVVGVVPPDDVPCRVDRSRRLGTTTWARSSPRAMRCWPRGAWWWCRQSPRRRTATRSTSSPPTSSTPLYSPVRLLILQLCCVSQIINARTRDAFLFYRRRRQKKVYLHSKVLFMECPSVVFSFGREWLWCVRSVRRHSSIIVTLVFPPPCPTVPVPHRHRTTRCPIPPVFYLPVFVTVNCSPRLLVPVSRFLLFLVGANYSPPLYY